MVLLRLVRWLVWPRRERDWEDPPRRKKAHAPSFPTRRSHHPGSYRIEVDSEAGRFHGDGPPFSFWSSSRIILILSFILWWIQPAGPMVAGYVGGRRAGSPMKAVVAAFLPVIVIFLANLSYAANVASRQIDFVASLPMVVSDALASILPFLLPYKEFLVSYMTGFVSALSTVFGMGTNGYLMVVIFAYIGGLIAEQTRRELVYRSGSGTSVGVNLLHPLLGLRPHADMEEEPYEDDEEVHRTRRPVRARGRRHPAVVGLEGGRRRRRDRRDHFESYRKVSAEVDDGPRHRAVRSRRRQADEDDDEDAADDGEEVVVTRTHRVPRDRPEEEEPRHRRTPHRRDREDDEPEDRPEPPSRPVRARSQAEERAIQRFVERALRNYDHSKL